MDTEEKHMPPSSNLRLKRNRTACDEKSVDTRMHGVQNPTTPVKPAKSQKVEAEEEEQDEKENEKTPQEVDARCDESFCNSIPPLYLLIIVGIVCVGVVYKFFFMDFMPKTEPSADRTLFQSAWKLLRNDIVQNHCGNPLPGGDGLSILAANLEAFPEPDYPIVFLLMSPNDCFINLLQKFNEKYLNENLRSFSIDSNSEYAEVEKEVSAHSESYRSLLLRGPDNINSDEFIRLFFDLTDTLDAGLGKGKLIYFVIDILSSDLSAVDLSNYHRSVAKLLSQHFHSKLQSLFPVARIDALLARIAGNPVYII